jgi:glyoxylase-like metal-dependent hydrolase (beta-lactamase superfamily II)
LNIYVTIVLFLLILKYEFHFLIKSVKLLQIHHLNCAEIQSAASAGAIGHCLLLEYENVLILVDAGIGLLDIAQKDTRLGEDLIQAVGFILNEEQTAYNQILKPGLDPDKVKHCVVSHPDLDHIGGIADFPGITLHVPQEEYDNFKSGNKRYLPRQISSVQKINTYSSSGFTWKGLEARKVKLGIDTEIYLVPLFGHTYGHCGVAIKNETRWLFYIGDAYYYRLELETEDHPVAKLAASRGDDNALENG